MEMFTARGVDLDMFDPNGGTILYWASCAGDIELVQFLLESGANPSQQTRYDWAPLHYAAHNGFLDCLLALLDAGAELSPMSDQSKTPLDMAIRGKQNHIANILRAKGAKTAQEVYAERGTDFSRLICDYDESESDSASYTNDEEDEDTDSEEDEDTDSEEDEDTPRLIDLFFLLARNWDRISFSDQQVAQDVRAYLRRDIKEILADIIECNFRELDYITDEVVLLWNELIVEL